ncbi:MAG TPA: hypothetical protein VE152_07870 [Acidimicrobiales bacterium]|nr:hypothetical protein [Acidimicrobiales bacterium]
MNGAVGPVPTWHQDNGLAPVMVTLAVLVAAARPGLVGRRSPEVHRRLDAPGKIPPSC